MKNITDMVEPTFKFRISIGFYSLIDLWIEIPMDLYMEICDSVGKSQIERFEFGFRFADIIKEKYPQLDAYIHQEIDRWRSENYGVDIPENALHLYGLTSPWFDI